MLALSGCVATAGQHKFEVSDNSFGIFDKVYTSAEYPKSRTSYIPTNKELQRINGSDCVKRLENNYFYLKTSFNNSTDVYIQKTDNDCWAACSIMLLNHDKVKFSSKDIDRIRDELFHADSPKNEADIFAKLINSFKKVTYTRPITGDMLYGSIGMDHLLLVGFQNPNQDIGHIEIVIALYFSYIEPTFADSLVKRKIQMCLDKVVLLDPANGETQEVTGDEFVRRANFGISFLPSISQVGLINFKMK
ncbi:hypothetical protein JCM15519_06670 [Fundidesulfovibrio butyratiphilus]